MRVVVDTYIGVFRVARNERIEEKRKFEFRPDLCARRAEKCEDGRVSKHEKGGGRGDRFRVYNL